MVWGRVLGSGPFNASDNMRLCCETKLPYRAKVKGIRPAESKPDASLPVLSRLAFGKALGGARDGRQIGDRFATLMIPPIMSRRRR